jgi:hypothetical protein
VISVSPHQAIHSIFGDHPALGYQETGILFETFHDTIVDSDTPVRKGLHRANFVLVFGEPMKR